MRIVVTGGTGTVGSHLVRMLVERGEEVRVVTRAPQRVSEPVGGVEYREGDLGELGTLVPAFQGAQALYLLTPLDPCESSLGQAAVEAADAVGLEHVVFQSIHNVERAPHIPHFHTKIEIIENLRDSGLNWSLISPNNFFQNDLALREPLLERGLYAQPFGTVGMSRIDARDIAEAAANVLTGRVPAGREYTLVGPDVLTAEETASIWGRHLGREISYAGDDLEAWAPEARAAMPDWLVDDLAVMFAYFQKEGLAASPHDLDLTREALGREPRSFDAFAAETAASWKG